jgi:two-component system LytT family sensor kinase
MEIAPETVNALVPNLILQPLVENAIRHGISQTDSSGVLVIKTHCENGDLHIAVSDDGPGLRADWPGKKGEKGEGIGLANTNERLKHLYGKNHRFDLRNRETGGVTATIAIPFRTESDLGT